MSRMSAAERAGRLLDAATDLFVRLGYAKTTVSDITSAAGVSKGAFYLAFDSKDALVEALLIREMARFSEAWLLRVEAHPRGGGLGGLYAAMLRALDENALISFITSGAGSVLVERALQRPDSALLRLGDGQLSRRDIVARLQAAGTVRDDIAPDVVAYILDIFAHGLAAAPGAIPSTGGRPPTPALISGIADIMDRALTPEDADMDAGKQIIREAFAEGRRRYAALGVLPRDDEDTPS